MRGFLAAMGLCHAVVWFLRKGAFHEKDSKFDNFILACSDHVKASKLLIGPSVGPGVPSPPLGR
jgi:hypothetical protein